MTDTQRRQFSRIRFHSGASLTVQGRDSACEVLDLSLKGALLATTSPLAAPPGTPCRLSLQLGEGDAVVRMEGEVAHTENAHLGMVCREIDLDSITHLRRLLELNLGDADLLHREFSALIAE